MNTAEQTSFRDIVAEIGPLAGAIAGEGPPVILLVGPLTLFALVLSAPFAFLLVLVAAMLVVAAAVVALVAAPFLIVRGVRSLWARRAPSTDRAGQVVPFGSTRVAT